MATLRRASEKRRPKRPWFRSFHRWLGGIAAFFVLFLAVTGIALNHGHEWRLDQRFVSWGWLLDAYGIHAPEFADSFTAGGHRATLLGQHLYLDERLVAADADGLNGMVALEMMLVVATGQAVLLLTREGELIVRLDLATVLPGTVQRLGIEGALYRTLRSTNPIENLNDSVTTYTRNVKRWRNGSMIVRWVSAAVLDASQSFRRIRGYRELQAVVVKLERLEAGSEETTRTHVA